MTIKKRVSVTIKDVAADAGVSLQTVSRVINNGPNVSDKARAKVEQSVARLGYSPSIAARRMGGSKSFILLALNDRDRTIEAWRLREGTDWVDQMLLGGMLKCAEHGYRMIFELVDTHGDNIERELRAALSATRPDGVILTPPHSDNPDILRILADEGIRAARIGAIRDAPGTIIRMDDHGASQEAVDHLVGLGHRRIGFIAGSNDYALSEARAAGYRDAIRRHGLSSGDDLLFQGDFGYESGLAGARHLLALADRPTAIIASSDQMALAAVAVARERGLAVPADLSIISFDGTPIVRMSIPPLTAINQPIAEMTSCAAEILILPDGDLAGSAKRGPHIIPFDLVARESTGPAPR